MNNLKYVTAFVGARDSFIVPNTLYMDGLLACHVTDFMPKGLLRRILSSTKSKFLNGMRKRSNYSFPESLVENRAVKKLMVRKAKDVFKIKNFAPEINFSLGKDALDIAIRTDTNLLLYSYAWMGVMSELINFPNKKVLFQLHPLPSQFRTNLSTIRNTNKIELEEDLSKNFESKYIESIKNADRIICASTFIKNGLVENGINSNLINVVPYIYQFNGDYNYILRKMSPQGKLRILYIGSLIRRKGLELLLDSIEILNTNRLELHVVSRDIGESNLLQRVKRNHIFHHAPSDYELRQLIASMHLFCMPSYLEGFGLVYVEALASGLPVIGGKNTGLPDLIKNNIHGFILNDYKNKSLSAIIDKYLSNPSLIEEQSRSISDLINSYSPSSYSNLLLESLC